MLFFGRLDAKPGWTKQLHLGARRNVNTRMLPRSAATPATTRSATIARSKAWPGISITLEQNSALPKTILYNNNPGDNYTLATMAGNFQDGSLAGKMQFGSGWWYLDQKDGIEWQLNALSNVGLLAHFVGMLTDSRSFMSYPRHEYFRRVLCNLLGAEMERGELPNDRALVGRMVEDICFANAHGIWA